MLTGLGTVGVVCLEVSSSWNPTVHSYSSSSAFDVMVALTRSSLRECRILGCQEQILYRPPELGFEGHTSGPYLLPCLLVE